MRQEASPRAASHWGGGGGRWKPPRRGTIGWEAVDLVTGSELRVPSVGFASKT